MADKAAGENVHASSFVESVKEKITDAFHEDDSLLSDSEDEENKNSPATAVKHKIYRLFGRERPVHKVLGGGKAAHILLWRDKKVSAGVLGFATSIWVLFELVQYHLLSLVCHALMLSLAVCFLWSKAAALTNKSAPEFPMVALPEHIVLDVASALRIEINGALSALGQTASRKGLKKFLAVIACLWVLSLVGSCCNFLTLLYTCFVVLHTVPALYERHEDRVDGWAEKAVAEIKKKCGVFSVMGLKEKKSA